MYYILSQKEYTGETPSTATAFVPESFQGGPFKALMIASISGAPLKCIASKRNGTLSPIRGARSSCNQGLKVLTINCRSLRSQLKRDELCLLVDTHKPDIINATETHLNSTISSSELGLQDYEIFRKDRPDYEMPGGGVLISIKKNIIASQMTVSRHEDLEAVWCKI